MTARDAAAGNERVTYVSQLTPAGRGAIATVGVIGPLADDAVATHFRSIRRLDPTRCRLHRIYFGTWLHTAGDAEPDPVTTGEELVICRVGPEHWEVHCHGGPAAVEAILESLVRSGCQRCGWAEFQKHAAALDHRRAGTTNDTPVGSVTPWQQQAKQALAAATTERAALVLLDQLNGALDRAFQQATDELAHGQSAAGEQRLARLLAAASTGLHLTNPWRVTLAGLPNVGKSSLINALVGFERTVTYDQPGTTRDVVRVRTALDGWPVELSDTAGLRPTDDPLEQAGIERARQQIAASDLTLLVLAAAPWDADALEYGRRLAPNSLLVINKCDLMTAATAVTQRPRDALWVSAKTGEGIPRLINAIVQHLVPHPPAAGDAVPFTHEQVEQIRALLAGDRPT